ncbi:hypothetical protein GE09DRAFT_1085922 [Coniochaeta sp. 2T2.1]|nr:hypothetical protein GE09DRAFT_1085922 [Coniochaeta sp. 2T2.1]
MIGHEMCEWLRCASRSSHNWSSKSQPNARMWIIPNVFELPLQPFIYLGRLAVLELLMRQAHLNSFKPAQPSLQLISISHSNMLSISSVLLTAGLAMQASAATITVLVGQGGNFAFTPNEVNAAIGDIVEFQFPAGGNHSVVEGDFNNACQPAATGGFFSGYMNTLSGPAVSPAAWC